MVDVIGLCDDAVSTVYISGMAHPVVDGVFEVTVPLVMGSNIVTAQVIVDQISYTDSITVTRWWEDNGGTVSTDYICQPSIGTVPLPVTMTVTITNLYPDQTRRIAGRIDVTLANGNWFPGWRAGYTNVLANDSYIASWTTTIPALAAVTGDNTFTLVTEDVSPVPFNQPPYPPSGDTDMAACTVTGVAP
jgi:hypothetical protein